MKKSLRTLLIAVIVGNSLCMTSYAASTFSEYWFQNSDGSWSISDGDQVIRDHWVCDNKVTYNHNTDTNWYLLDSNGKMYSNIILDQSTGKYYLLNPSHDGGTYGMMITSNGYSYNGVSFMFEQSHSGAFGSIQNVEAVAQSGLPVTSVNLAGKPSLYTANFGSSYGTGNSGSSGGGYNAGSGSSLGASNNISVGNSGSQQSSGGTQQLDSEGFVTNIGFSSEYENYIPGSGALDSSFFNNIGHDFSYYYENSVFG